MDGMQIVKNESKVTRLMGKPVLYVVTILIDSAITESDLEDRVNTFFHSLPSNDGSFNIMYADKRMIAKNRRLARID